nr:FAD-dependent oxidoreductase [Sphaerochaetaceae bacterium]
YLNPIDLKNSLESKRLEGLFIAGQTNGTSGYEEAACQGLIAGINACQKLKGAPALVLSRTEAYIGVLIDDLVTMGTKEPYRMFTSRAEYRLNLRHDTADERLTQKGFDCGLASSERLERLKEKIAKTEALEDLLHHRSYEQKNAYEAIKHPEISIEDMVGKVDGISDFEPSIRERTELKIKYDGYIKLQEKAVERFTKLESISIPEDFNYDEIDGLSAEGKEKLKLIRPESVGRASRISGVRTSDIGVLLIYLRK